MNLFKLLTLLFLITSSTYSCANNEDAPTEPPQKEINIVGDHVGNWSSVTPSNTYTRIPASARIVSTNDPNRFVGQFFFTASFVSCCNSGDNDGSLEIILDGNKITSFTYNDILPNCNGNFSGTGEISETGDITINFTGSDCEGEHNNGVLRF